MSICLNVAEKIDNPSALTQEQGNIIYENIVSAFEKNEQIIIDFVDVESIISPFLNNAIGRLYEKYRSEEISELLKIKNFPDVKKSTLNIVISNAKKFYMNKERFRNLAKEAIDS